MPDHTCAFCERPAETEVSVTDPSEQMELELGEDLPERIVPICRRHQRVVRNLPTIDEEPFPDWDEIEYGEEVLN